MRWLKDGVFAVAGETVNRGVQQELAARHKPQTYGLEP